MMSSTTRILFSSLCLTLAACPSIDNDTEREGEILDLSGYALTAITPAPTSDYWIAGRSRGRAVPAHDQVFIRNGDIHALTVNRTNNNGQRDWSIDIAHVDATGAVVQQYNFRTAALGLSNTAGVAAATGDDTGLVWMVADFDQLIALELTTGTVMHSYNVSAQTTALAYEPGALYVAIDTNVHVMDPTTGAIIADFGPALQQAYATNPIARIEEIAVFGGHLVVRGGSWEGDAIVLDTASRTYVGAVSDVPKDELFADATGFLGIDDAGQLVPFSLGSPVPAAPYAAVSAYSRAGAQAVAVAGGLLWTLYADGTNAPSFVGYDPTTQRPIQGFALTQPVPWEALDNEAGGRPFAMGSDGTKLYVLSNTEFNLYNQIAKSHVDVIEIATGRVLFDYDLPFAGTGLCFDRGAMYVAIADASGMGLFDSTGPVTLHELDPANGLVKSSITTDVEIAGPPTLACADGHLAISVEHMRRWSSVDATQTLGHRAVLTPTAGSDGAFDGSTMFLIDRERNLLTQIRRADWLP